MSAAPSKPPTRRRLIGWRVRYQWRPRDEGSRWCWTRSKLASLDHARQTAGDLCASGYHRAVRVVRVYRVTKGAA